MIRATALMASLLLAGCAATTGEQGGGMSAAAMDGDAALSIARGPIRMADGTHVGEAFVHAARDGQLTLTVAVSSYAPGTYGMHVHAVGRCNAPDFTTAGPHWNPQSRQHGRLNPAGTHHGDLPNLVVPASGITNVRAPLPGVARGEGGLLDADGAALVIHASPDDERTDPTGNSGARRACAVLTPR